MMHPVHFRPINAVLLVCMLAFSGCLGNPAKTPATRYYILNSTYGGENKTQPVTVLNDATVGIGPIKLTGVLDRPQIVTRTGENEVRVADLERWAAPLQEIVTNVLVDDLSALLQGAEVLKFPWQVTLPIDYQVVMDITRLDGMPGEDVVLKARWGILGAGGKKVLANIESMLKEPVRGNTIAEMVSALNRLVATFSREIAEEIKKVQKQGTGQ